jgi:hypothetical protein
MDEMYLAKRSQKGSQISTFKPSDEMATALHDWKLKLNCSKLLKAAEANIRLRLDLYRHMAGFAEVPDDK